MWQPVSALQASQPLAPQESKQALPQISFSLHVHNRGAKALATRLGVPEDGLHARLLEEGSASTLPTAGSVLWFLGFRLFFTSVPGGHEKEASPRPCRKRQPPSSSEDSDEELQRCREAAVSASDILQESAIHCPAKVEKEAEKKKLKKKAKKKADADLAAATGLEQVKEAGSVNGDPVLSGTKKKKKKKAKKAREASLGPPAECAAAEPKN